MSFLEIFPQNVTLFPSDRHLFTARASFPPPLWKDISQFGPGGDITGVLDPDFSVRNATRSLVDPEVYAEGALQLFGPGAAEFKVTTRCLPSSAVSFGIRWRLMFDGTSAQFHQYTLLFFSNKIEVEYNFSLIATINHITGIGDRFRVDLNNGFRFFINDQFVHEKTSFASVIKYPATFLMFINGAIVTTPAIIPAPRLFGNWELRPVVTFVAPSHGSISSPGTGLQTEYFNGTVPGVYKLIAKIDTGIEVWFEDVAPTGAVVSTGGGAWTFGSSNPVQQSGFLRLKSPTPAPVGEAFYFFNSVTDTLQVNKDDVMSVYVFLDAGDPPDSIVFQWGATDATGIEHRAYWGANLFPNGINGTPSRRFMGPLPPTGQWVRLEVPASLVDLEGRSLNAMAVSTFNGITSFDQMGKFPGKLQYAEATITIPALQILGDLVRTLQPDSKTRLQTNYDVAQTPGILTWSVLSGAGTFSGNEYTAPSAPGTNVLRASSTGNQVADMTVNVPAVITPGFTFAAPLEQIDFNTNIPSPTWSSVPAGINSGTGVIIFPNTPGATVRITATNGSFTATRDVLIMEKFPFSDFVFPFEVDWLKKILTSESEDGTSYIARIKSRARQSFPWRLTKCSVADLTTVRTFWDRHHPGVRFIMENLEEEIRLVVRTDSDLRWEYTDSGINITGRVKEAV